MVDILIRGIPDDLKSRIYGRAARHGHSLSREITLLIRHALAAQEAQDETPGDLGTRLASLVPAADWNDDFVVERERLDDSGGPQYP